MNPTDHIRRLVEGLRFDLDALGSMVEPSPRASAVVAQLRLEIDRIEEVVLRLGEPTPGRSTLTQESVVIADPGSTQTPRK